MGTDLDFAAELRKHKLVSSQFEQPVHELDGVTQDTQHPNGEFVLQLIQMLEQRLGNRLGNNDGPVAIVVQLGDNQRLIIAFQGTEMVRHDEPPRERNFQRLVREIMTNHEQPIQEQIAEQTPAVQVSEVSFEPQNVELATQQIAVRPSIHTSNDILQNWPQIDHDLSPPQDEFDIIGRRENQDEEEVTIQSKSLPREEELRHQQSVVLSIPQEHYKKNNNQLEENQLPYHLGDKNQLPLQSNERLEDKSISNYSVAADIQNQTINCLNQNSLSNLESPNKKVIKQQTDEEDILSCWQVFVRMVSNLFARNRGN